MTTFSCPVRGPYSDARVADFLDGTIVPMRLAVQTSGGFPVLLSLWFARHEGTLVAAVHRDAKIVRRLEENPRCAFEIALNTPPYRGVRGQATVRVDEARGGDVLEQLLVRYLGSLDSHLARWLLSRRSDELALVLDPVRIESWDYSSRMSGAGAATGSGSLHH